MPTSCYSRVLISLSPFDEIMEVSNVGEIVRCSDAPDTARNALSGDGLAVFEMLLQNEN